MDFTTEVIDKPIAFDKVKEICSRGFGDMVKSGVDNPEMCNQILLIVQNLILDLSK